MQDNRDAILSRAFERGKALELEYGNCAQCALAAVFEALGIENDDVFRAACGITDGIGLTGNGDCGALSGGVMAIGYLYGRSREDFPNTRKILKSNILSKKLHDWFMDEYGTCRCADVQVRLLGRSFDMYSPADFEEAERAGFRNYTSSVVAEVARKTAEIILDEREREAAKP